MRKRVDRNGQSVDLLVRHSDHQNQQMFARLLELVDTVSFDLFDTLLQRPGLFSPKDLFYRVQDEAEQQLGLRINNFVSMRIRAEESARVRAWGYGRAETTLDEIYAEFGRIVRLEPAVMHSLQKIELACERATLTALESGKQLYSAARAAGKRVIIVSDTYFAADFIAEILRRVGYGAVHNVYLSSTYGKTKADGSLYDVVLNDLQCAPGRLMHIGDNQLSDVTMALGKGIRAHYVPTPQHRLRWRCGMGDMPSGNLTLSALLSTASQKSTQEPSATDLQSVQKDTATENLSLLYYAFAAWLLEQLQEGGYRRVYFAARDGLVMKRFFDLVAAAAGFAIDSRYLYISRAALYPSLIVTDPATARQLFCRSWDHLTIKEALQRVSLTYDEGRVLLAKHGLANPQLRLDNKTAPQFLAFLTEIWPLLKRKNSDKYQHIVDYLRQEMVLTPEKAAFVDIGWHGSLQNCLVKFLNHLHIDKDLSGYYLGTLSKPVGVEPNFKARGFLVDDEEPRWIAELVRTGPSLLELFHSAGHGTVLGYRRQGARVLPVLEENGPEQKQFVHMIEPVQDLAFELVAEQLKKHAHRHRMRVPEPAVVARAALRVVYAPTIVEAAALGRLRIASDFGGRMKSITGAVEYDLTTIPGETLPDGTAPIWQPGFQMLRRA